MRGASRRESLMPGMSMSSLAQRNVARISLVDEVAMMSGREVM